MPRGSASSPPITWSSTSPFVRITPSIAPSVARIPQQDLAALERRARRARRSRPSARSIPHAISPFVPTSTSSRISGSRTRPVATMSATMSAPDVGADRREERHPPERVDVEPDLVGAQVLRLGEGGDVRRERDRLGVHAAAAGAASWRCRRRPPRRSPRSRRRPRPSRGRAARSRSRSRPRAAARCPRRPASRRAMRAITSAPNGAWWLIVEATATAAPFRRSTSVQTQVVVPMSNDAPNIRSVVSPGSTSTRYSPTSVAVTFVVVAHRAREPRQDLPVVVARVALLVDRVRARARGATGGPRATAAAARGRSFTTLGSSSTNRPTPIVAAFGIFIRRGTSTVIGPVDRALAREAPALVELVRQVAVVGERAAPPRPRAPSPRTCRTCRGRRTSTRSAARPSARR